MRTRFLVVFWLTAALGAATPSFAQHQSDADALVEAIRKEDNSKALELLRTSRVLVNARDSSGETPLSVALARSDREWTAELIRAGANVDAAGRNGDTPLVLAARNGFAEAVSWLLLKGAKVDSANKLGETALILAVQSRNARIVRALLAAKADPDKTDYAGYSARDYAKRDNRSKQMFDLIEATKPKG